MLGAFSPAALTLFVSATVVANAATSASTTTNPGPVVTSSAPAVPAPHDLRRTSDRNACLSHGGGSYCQDASHFRKPVLIWEWKGNLDAIDGFRLYQVTGGRTLAKQIPALLNQQITWGIQRARAGQCFVATAYAGSQESADSNQWCAPYTVAP